MGFSPIIQTFALKPTSPFSNSFRHAVARITTRVHRAISDVSEHDYDVDYVVMRFRLPGGPERERVLDCIRLVWGRGVATSLKAASACACRLWGVIADKNEDSS